MASPEASPDDRETAPVVRDGRLLAAHLWTHGLFAVVGTALFLYGFTLPESRWEPLGVGTFPQIVLGVLVALNALGFIGRLRERRQASPPAQSFKAALYAHRLVFIVMGALAAFVVLLPILGFALASLLFLLAVQLRLSPLTRRSLVTAVIVALAGSFGLDYLFANVFSVFLPDGMILG